MANVFDQFDTHGHAPAPAYLEASTRGVAQGGALGPTPEAEVDAERRERADHACAIERHDARA